MRGQYLIIFIEEKNLGRNPFEARLRNATEMIKLLHQNKAPRALLVSKTRDRGMCKDRPQGIQCCLGQDWNCQERLLYL